jgi:hypothetical protein
VDHDQNLGVTRRAPRPTRQIRSSVAAPPTEGDLSEADQTVAPHPRRRRLAGRLPAGRLLKRLPKAAKLALACVSLVAVLDLMGALQATTHERIEDHWIGPAKPTSRWLQEATQPSAATIRTRRLLTFELDREQLTARYDLWLPPDHALFRAVQGGKGQSDVAWLVHDVLGEVRVGELPQGLPNSQRTVETTLDFLAPVVHVTTVEGHIQVTAKPYWYRLPRLQISVDRPDTTLPLDTDVTVLRPPPAAGRSRSDRLQVFNQGGVTPVWQSDTQALFDRLGSAQSLRFMVMQPDKTGLWSALFAMGGASLPVLAQLQGRLPNLLVALVLLWLLNSAADRLDSAGEIVRTLADMVRVLVLFALGLAVAGILVDATFSLGTYTRPLAMRLAGPDVYIPKQVGAFALTIVAAGLLWPLVVVRMRKKLSTAAAGMHSDDDVAPTMAPATKTGNGASPDSGGVGADVRIGGAEPADAPGAVSGKPVLRITITVLAVAVTLLAVGTAGLLPWMTDDGTLRHPAGVTATVIALAVVVVLLSRYLVRELLGRGGIGKRGLSVVAAVAALVSIGVTVMLPVVGYVYTNQVDAARLGVFVALAVMLAVTYAIYAAIVVEFVAVAVARSRWSRWLGLTALLALLVLTVPDSIGVALDPGPASEAGPWSLFTLGDSLNSVSYYLLLGCLLAALHTMSNAGLVHTDDATDVALMRRAGIVFAFLTFYWTGEQWFALPISLLLGWLVAATVAFPSDSSATDTRWFTNRVVDLAEQLRAVSDALTSSRARLQQKFKQGEIEHDEFAAKRQPMDRALRVAARRASELGDAGKDLTVLRKRLRAGGWWHGVQGAWWGLILGVPWIAIYLWQIGSVPVAHTDYEGLDFGLGAAGWIVLQWPLYGFFFGYFYPYLRGHNGVVKALSMFMTVVVPPIVHHALAYQRTDWQGYGVFTLQMLVFSLLLGLLAGDYLLLRRVGMHWPQLLEVHNLRFVVTVGSSIVVASGGILATVLTSGLTAVVSTLLEQAGIVPPNMPTSKTP